MTTTRVRGPEDLEALARELFVEVHGRLGHLDAYLEHKRFEDSLVKAAWVEIACCFDEGFAVETRWLDDYAYALFTRVHERLGDAPKSRYHFEDSITSRRLTWGMIVRVFEEWRARSKS